MSYRDAMKRGGNWMALGTGGVLLIAAVRADVGVPGEPAKHVFLVRNPFGLKPQPTNTVPPGPTPPPVKVDLKLAGITVDSRKRAWIVIPPSPARPGVAAVTNSTHFAIAEGERQGDIEVLAIDPRENTVKILNAGVEVTLDFASHGLAAPALPAKGPAGLPGAPRVMPAPGVSQPGIPQPAVPIPAPGVKTAAFNPQPQGTAANPLAAASYAEPSAALRTIPARNVRTSPEAPVAVDPAEQIIRMRLQEAQMRSAGVPYPPLPPVPGLPPPE